MNRVYKDGKILGYDVTTGKLFDLKTYKTVEERKVISRANESEENKEK